MAGVQRVGFIVPSSNVTIETEVPRLLGRDGSLSFHSSRAVLHRVDPESLDRMVADSDRCAQELADAAVDVLVYACLVAVMARGPGAHEEIERRLAAAAAERGCAAPVVSSAGAIVSALRELGAERVAIITPYLPALTQLVSDYLDGAGFAVVDAVSLGVPENVAVGRLDPQDLLAHAERLDLAQADVLVASACVQMPSLPVIDELEARVGLPVISAATATTAALLDALGRPRALGGGGALLRGPEEAAVA
jgi:maleate isomerase